MTLDMSKAVTFFAAVAFGFEATAAQTPKLDYNRDIRPILSDKCYTCHGPDNNKRKAGLRLDRNEEPFKKLDSGNVAIVPQHPEKSELIRRIKASDADDKMPPADAKQLSKAEIDLLAKWVKEGAEWQGHWSYLTPHRPNLPKVRNQKWVRNAVDQFILARLQKEGLKPSREADKEHLIRRVTLDLTGLPPTIEEIDAFIADKSANAYEKLVDRLLASPAFGERMAQMWLDLARYADTNGYHIDNHRDMWLFRDWVINAFNKNMPFDRFTIEQLAGDMLPNATVEQKIASGFNRNNMVNFEGGADPDEYATKYVVDRIVTTSTTWLGATMGCAECHDHKYDPFTQKEFYQLYALFNNIPEKGLDGQKENPVPSMKVPSAEQTKKKQDLQSTISSLEKSYKSRTEDPDEKLDAEQAKWEKEVTQNVFSGWETLQPNDLKSTSGAIFTNLLDQSFLATGTNADKDTYEFTIQTPATNVSGVRIEALADDSLPHKKAGRGVNGNFVLTTFEVEAKNPDPKANLNEPFTMGNWQALGPFKSSNQRRAFKQALIDEKRKVPDLTKTYDGGGVKWTEKPDWKDGQVQNLDGGDFAVYYLYRKISVKHARPVLVSLGSDDGIQVWFNGKQILSNDASRAAEADQEKILLWLEPGDNHLLMKINNGSGGFAYYFKAKEDALNEFPIQFASAIADFSQKDFDVKAAIDKDPNTGWAIDAEDGDHRAIFISNQPFGFPTGTILKVRMKFESKFERHTIGRFRVSLSTSESLTTLGSLPANMQSVLFKPEDKRKKEQVAELKKYYRMTFVPEVEKLDEDLRGKRDELTKLEEQIPSTMVMQEMEKPRDTFVLVRGNFQQKGEKVSPGIPKSLLGSATNPTNRLQLAQWIVAAENPLASRVTVNRFWQMLFGTGLVKSANDFGSQGEWPSHPELLDWLATEFRDQHWDMKHMIKLMVMSATYRQSSEITPQLLERDKYNRLYARGPRVRMDAEVIRDNALAVSGLLNRKIGGESVRPYQPAGLWEALAFGAGFSSQNYVQSKGDDLYRRGIYVYWKRSLPYPSMVTFDAPNREVCTATRPRTTTPLQALVLMNDPAYIEAARGLAQRVLKESSGSIEERLKFAFRVTLARQPEPQELEVLSKIYHQQLDNFSKDKEAAKALLSVGESTRSESLDVSELAAWTAIGNVLLNLDETITKG